MGEVLTIILMSSFFMCRVNLAASRFRSRQQSSDTERRSESSSFSIYCIHKHKQTVDVLLLICIQTNTCRTEQLSGLHLNTFMQMYMLENAHTLKLFSQLHSKTK